MTTNTKIRKVATKCKIDAQKGDFAFWQTQSHQARIDALEAIRREYNSWKYGTDPGFQIVYRVVKRK